MHLDALAGSLASYYWARERIDSRTRLTSSCAMAEIGADHSSVSKPDRILTQSACAVALMDWLGPTKGSALSRRDKRTAIPVYLDQAGSTGRPPVHIR